MKEKDLFELGISKKAGTILNALSKEKIDNKLEATRALTGGEPEFLLQAPKESVDFNVGQLVDSVKGKIFAFETTADEFKNAAILLGGP